VIAFGDVPRISQGCFRDRCDCQDGKEKSCPTQVHSHLPMSYPGLFRIVRRRRWLLRQLEGLLPYVDLDEIEIADVDQEPEPLAHNEHRVAPVERVDKEQQAAADR